MRALALLIAPAILTPMQAGQPAGYSAAVDKYVTADGQGAANILGALPRERIRKEIQALLDDSTGVSGGNRRLEAAAMLHSDYAMQGALDPQATTFHVDMAHLLLRSDRSLLQEYEQRVRSSAGSLVSAATRHFPIAIPWPPTSSWSTPS